MGYVTTFSTRSLRHYVIVKHRISDIEFFKVETAFLHRLLDEHFVSLCCSNRVGMLKQVGANLLNLEKNESKTNDKLRYQLRELGWIAKNLVTENKDRLSASQVEIEYMMVNLIREYHEVRKEIFGLIEGIRRGNKQLIS